MKQIEVQILQQSYLLACAEGQETRLLEAVERVDTAMTRVRDTGKVRARERIAVLVALNLAFEIADRDVVAAVTAQARAEYEGASGTAAQTEGGVPADERLSQLIERLDEVLGEQHTQSEQAQEEQASAEPTFADDDAQTAKAGLQ